VSDATDEMAITSVCAAIGEPNSVQSPPEQGTEGFGALTAIRISIQAEMAGRRSADPENPQLVRQERKIRAQQESLGGVLYDTRQRGLDSSFPKRSI